MSNLRKIAELAYTAPYNSEAKSLFKAESVRLLRRIAKDLGLPARGCVSFNPGGIAVSVVRQCFAGMMELNEASTSKSVHPSVSGWDPIPRWF